MSELTPERILLTIQLPVTIDAMFTVTGTLFDEFPSALIRSSQDGQSMQIFIPAKL